MEWNPKQHSKMYYDADTKQSPSQKWYHTNVAIDKNITSGRHCNMMKSKRRSDLLNKQDINPHKKSPSFIFLWWGQIFPEYGNFKIWPWKSMAKVTGKVTGHGHIWNTSASLFSLLLFRTNRTVFQIHRQFIIWPWNFEVKVIDEFKEYASVNLVVILMAIVAKPYSKYGILTYISKHFIYMRLYINVDFSTIHSGHLLAYFASKIIHFWHRSLATNPKSYSTLHKRHFDQRHKHYYGSLSHLARYVFLVLVGLGHKIEVLLIIMNCQTNIYMSFLKTHVLCYKALV